MKLLGRIAFWLSWPALWLYLRGSHRTRVIISCQGKVLVIKNWLGDDRWSLPGGGRHRDELAPIAACREVREETGIHITPEQLRLIGTFTSTNRGFRFHYDLFTAELATQPNTKPQVAEIASIAWQSPEEIRQAKASPDLLHGLDYWLA